MRIQLSDHFTYRRLLRFVFPTIVMMLFTSIYGIVDGFFVSNVVGKTPFAALNIVWPFIMILGAIGFMLGAGGSAIISKTFGERDSDRANRYFSMIIYSAIIISAVLGAIGFIWMRPIAYLLGADDTMIGDCVVYGRILLAGLPPFMLQYMFQALFITAERPRLGLVITVAAGVTNMILDFLFIYVFEWGLAGAALATVLGEVVGGVIPIIYFASKNSSIMRLGRARFEGRVFLKTCTNGSSELLTNISMSIISILYNRKLMAMAGEDGVAAYGVIMYVAFIFIAVFLGYTAGMAPLVSYNYGAENRNELHNLYKKSLVITTFEAVIMTTLAMVFAPALASIFVSYDKVLYDMTVNALILYSTSFLVCGYNIFSSAFFTALNNGLVSATISFSRTMVFQIASLFILPIFLEINGIWLSITSAELCELVITIIFFIKMDGRYGYRKSHEKKLP